MHLAAHNHLLCIVQKGDVLRTGQTQMIGQREAGGRCTPCTQRGSWEFVGLSVGMGLIPHGAD